MRSSGSLARVTTLFLRALRGTQCPIHDRTSTINLIALDILIPRLLPLLRHRPSSTRLRNASRQKRGVLAGHQAAVEAKGRSLASSVTFSYYADPPTNQSRLLRRSGSLTLVRVLSRDETVNKLGYRGWPSYLPTP